MSFDTYNPILNYPPNSNCLCGSGKKFKYCCKESIPRHLPKEVVEEMRGREYKEMFDIFLQITTQIANNQVKAHNKLFSWKNFKRRVKQFFCNHTFNKAVLTTGCKQFTCSKCDLTKFTK